jgi:hypothetical protein
MVAMADNLDLASATDTGIGSSRFANLRSGCLEITMSACA